MNKKNFNEVLKQRELQESQNTNDTMTLDSTERIKVLSPGQLVFKRFINNKLAIAGSMILIFMFVFSFIAPILYPYSQTQIFYKYANTVIDYAIASERTEFSTMLLDENSEIHYSVKNYLTSTINTMKAEGLTESSLSDDEGNVYTLVANEDSIYSLYQSNRTEVASIAGETKYASYNSLLKDFKLEAGAEEYEGIKEAIGAAVDAKKTEFTHGGNNFVLKAGKKGAYTVYITGNGVSYTNGSLGADFEAVLNENLENTSFTFEDVKYTLSTVDNVTYVYKIAGESLLAYLTTYVFDAYDNTFVISNDFKEAAIAAKIANSNFTVDGVEYSIVEEEDETVVYKAADTTTPVAVFSHFVIRAYSGEDTLEYAFKEKARETIDAMNDAKSLTGSFDWEIAQVDSNGEYTYDENGNYVKENRTITLTNKNGSYVMNCEQVVYLIDIFAAPTKAHIFGTDGDGMDVLARMMYGGRVSLLVSFIVIIIQTILGVIMGGIAGFFGGWIDNLIMRMVDIFFCIPSMPILIILGAMFDALKMKPYVRLIWLMLVLGVLGWAGVARMVRGQILSLREQEFMVAAEAIGLNTSRRIFKHLVPNVMPQLIVSATSGLGGVIITESTLSFLGLGVKHPLATWGTMINSVSSAEMMKSYTYIWVPVGLLICLTVIAFNFVGDGLRDAFDPKMKR